MRGSRVLKQLYDHQENVLSIMRGSEALLAHRDVAGLTLARWAQMRALAAYKLFKHREIFDPTIAGPTLGDAAKAQRMKAACVAMDEAFKVHVARWSTADMGASWSVYEASALAMIARLRAHIVRERREVDALLMAA